MRNFEEIDSLGSVSEPVLSACEDGVVTALSIFKKGKNKSFFDVSISDKKTKLSIMRFQEGQHNTIQDFLCTKQVVAKLMFKKPSGNTLALHAFGEMVKKLANLSKNAVVSESHWMSAPPSQVNYNSARVVQQQC